MLEYNRILSDEQAGVNGVPPQLIADDDVIPSDDQKGVERGSPSCKIPYPEICQFEETGEILL